MSNTLTIQVEDKNVMAGLKKVLSAMSGVVILSSHKKKKSGKALYPQFISHINCKANILINGSVISYQTGC